VAGHSLGGHTASLLLGARLTWAYLRTGLYPGDPAWETARDALTAGPSPLGRVESS
jgi:hypothetical protein